MARLYEMCNDLDSSDILSNREELSEQERAGLMAGIKNRKGEKKNNKGKYVRAGKIAAWAAAAAVAAFVIIPNTSAKAAYAMEQIPILGNVIKAVTIREYNYESERFEADIKEVELQKEEIKPQGGLPEAGEAVSDNRQEEIEQKTDESIAIINESVEDMTNRLIAEFEEQVALGESYGGVYMDHEVMSNTDTWFTLKLDVAQVAGSGAQWQYYYHIDKTTGEIATLKDLFIEGADYITPISENIIKQMRERMAADDSLYYWVDDEEVPEWNFKEIKEEQNFYLNEQGQIVVCFDEYEVAPGYMGLVEFTIEEEAVAEILK